MDARRLNRAGVALCLVALLLTLARGWRLAYDPAGLPTWDSAAYLLDAVRFRDDLAAGDLDRLARDLTRPDLHPPLHSFLLGGWLLVFGNTLAAARAYPVAAFAVALALAFLLGRALGRSTLAGAAVALLTGVGLTSLELLTTPMTEATAVPVTLAVLLGMVATAERTDARARLLVGLGVLVATLVRYNLGPMLLAPLFLHHAWEVAGRRRRWNDAGVVLWVLPTVLLFLAWQAVRPELYGQIVKFLENRTSGIPFWSVENFLWVATATRSAFLGSWLVVAPLFLLFLLGLRGGDARVRLVQAYVLVSFAALTWHSFKVERNLAAVLPAFYATALVGLAGLRAPAWAPLAGALGLVAHAGWQNVATLPVLATRGDFRADPVVREVLDFVLRHGEARPRTWVVGWVFRLSPGLFDYWFRVNGSPSRLLLDMPSFGEQSRTGVDASWSEAYATRVTEQMLAPEHRDDTTFVTLETVPGTRYYDDWKAFGNNYARAFAAQSLVPEVDRLHLVDRGLLVRVYRTGDPPSAATLAALDTGPRPQDDQGVRLPAEPLYRDPLRGGGPTWMVYPPAALDRVTVRREDSALVLTVPEPLPALQLCDRPRPAPARAVRTVVHLATDGLEGRAWLHFRGMDDQDRLQDRPGGGPDITQAGPLAATGGQVVETDVALAPPSTRLRACVVLDGARGTLTLDDYAVLDAGAPRLAAADAAALRPIDDEGVTLPAGEVVARQPFAGPEHGWRAVGEGITLGLDARGLKVTVADAGPGRSVCGPPQAWSGPGRAVVHLLGAGGTGRPWVHLRPLDADGVLVKGPDGAAAIVQAGPVAGDGPWRAEVALDPPAGTTQVRPCLVLDGAAGAWTLDDLAYLAGR